MPTTQATRKSRKATPGALAARVINARIAEALNPDQMMGDVEFMMAGSTLIDALSTDALPLEAHVAFEDKLRQAAPGLVAEYIKLSDSNGAVAVGHFRAGVLLGVELGRAIPKGGRW